MVVWEHALHAEMNPMLNETYTLSNGVKIPRLGLGTWFIDDNIVGQVVRDAVDAGYRHIDTAQAYMNEGGVGEGIRTCGVPREDLFIVTKLAAEIKDYAGAIAAIDGSLQKMGLETIDLMIIHSPQPGTNSGKANTFLKATARHGVPLRMRTKPASCAP